LRFSGESAHNPKRKRRRFCGKRAKEIVEEIYPPNIALLNRILEKRNIGLETWLRDHAMELELM
jgi:hypothetical protein